MLYKEYLKSEMWLVTRNRIVKERVCCEICGSKDNLNVHHKSYKNGTQKFVLGNEPDGLLLLLCQDCHHLWHRLFGRIKLRQGKVYRIKRNLSKGLNKVDAFLFCNYRGSLTDRAAQPKRQRKSH